MIGQFLKATSRTASRSGARASILCAGLLLSAAARSAVAQTTPATDTVRADTVTRTVRADTVTQMLAVADTTKSILTFLDGAPVLSRKAGDWA